MLVGRYTEDQPTQRIPSQRIAEFYLVAHIFFQNYILPGTTLVLNRRTEFRCFSQLDFLLTNSAL
jgi:hypothetical protein